jgi:uncharacterized membrane protein
MIETIEKIKSTINLYGEFIEVLLNAISLLFILVGFVISIATVAQYRKKFPGYHPLHTNFRMTFGGWLVVALEFQLAADIVGTIILPSVSHLIELGSIAVIRTFLNFFLNKELLEQRKISQARLEEKGVETS